MEEIKQKADELIKAFCTIQITDYRDGKPYTRTMENAMGVFAASTCAEAMIRECKINNPERVDFWVKVKQQIG